MTQATDSDFSRLILERLDKIDREIQETNARLEARLDQSNQRMEKLEERIEAEVRRWDERFFQMNRDFGQTSRTIIIAAASVVILSPLLQSLAPAIGAIVDRLVGGAGG